jgi:putative tryptophan/tyrosine transport system substrate-binding protein
MRRRDLTIGLLLATAVGRARGQEPAKQHRIAIVIPAGPVAVINETSSDTLSRRLWQPFFEELRRLGNLEGQNLIVERYSGEGKPEGYADLAREVAGRNPDVIVAISNLVALAVRAATGTLPIVWVGVEPVGVGLVTSLAHPGGNLTGVSLYDVEIYGKRLQILKEASPSASKVALLGMRRTQKGAYGAFDSANQEADQRLQVSLVPMLLQESAPSEYQRVFAEIARQRFDGILVSDIPDLIPYRQLIVELVEKSRLPAIYGTVSSWRRAGCWPMRPTSANKGGAWPMTCTRS